jgi:hypothetical protein
MFLERNGRLSCCWWIAWHMGWDDRWRVLISFVFCAIKVMTHGWGGIRCLVKDGYDTLIEGWGRMGCALM